VWGFGRTIALRRFIAVQQFRADSGTGFVTAAMTAVACSMQFVLPNRTPFPATREAGLVQIAESLIDDWISRPKSRLVGSDRQLFTLGFPKAVVATI
jgi:hypothetical protein